MLLTGTVSKLWCLASKSLPLAVNVSLVCCTLQGRRGDSLGHSGSAVPGVPCLCLSPLPPAHHTPPPDPRLRGVRAHRSTSRKTASRTASSSSSRATVRLRRGQRRAGEAAGAPGALAQPPVPRRPPRVPRNGTAAHRALLPGNGEAKHHKAECCSHLQCVVPSALPSPGVWGSCQKNLRRRGPAAAPFLVLILSFPCSDSDSVLYLGL